VTSPEKTETIFIRARLRGRGASDDFIGGGSVRPQTVVTS